MTADLMNSDFRLFKIEIDKNEYPTHDNMPITGHIKIELKKPLIIKAIKIQFKGRALHRENGNESEKVRFLFFANFFFFCIFYWFY